MVRRKMYVSNFTYLYVWLFIRIIIKHLWNPQCLGLSPIELIHREVDYVDIAYDEISAKHYKEEEVIRTDCHDIVIFMIQSDYLNIILLQDPKFFQSKRTGRGPLIEGWRDTVQPIMCSYKLINASFEVWGMQTRVEDFIHRVIYIMFEKHIFI